MFDDDTQETLSEESFFDSVGLGRVLHLSRCQQSLPMVIHWLD